MTAPLQRYRAGPKTQDGRRLRRFKRRRIVERFFAWLLWRRCVFTRRDYHAESVHGFAQLAALSLLLKPLYY